MSPKPRFARTIATALAVVVALDPTLVRTASQAHAAEERKPDLTALGVAPIRAPGSGPPPPSSHLPVGFDDLANFHASLVPETEGYFRIEYQDVTIPGRGPALEVRRIYNSFVKRKSAFGRGWGWNYGVRLAEDEDTGNPVIVEADNLRVHFRPEGSGFAAVNSALREELRLGAPAVRTRSDGTKQYFGDGGRLVAIEDAAGRRLELRYAGKQLVEAVDSVGRSLRFEYADDRVVKITDPIGREWRYDYDGDKLVAAVDPLGRKTRHVYLPKFGWAERMSHVRFPNGADMTIYYHPLSKRVIRIAGPGPMATRFRFSVNVPAREIRRWTWNPRGHRSESEFFGERLEAQEPSEGEDRKKPPDELFLDKRKLTSIGYMPNVTRTRDPEGGRAVVGASASEIVIEDAESRTTRITKDAAGRVATVTDPMGRVSTLAWDASAGRPASVTLPGGRTFAFGFSGGELRSLTDPTGATVRMEPSENGYRIVDPTGLETRVDLDAYGHPARVREPDGAETAFGYDAVGRLLSVTAPGGATSTFRYDAGDNLVETRTPAGGVTRAEYDAMDNPVRVVDADGVETRFEYDARGLLTASTDPFGARLEFEYDRAGNLVAASRRGDPAAEDRFAYDRNGLLERMRDPLGGETRMLYDRVGQLEGAVLPVGGRVAYRYDVAGRLRSESLPDGTSLRIEYGTDSWPASVSFLGDRGALSLRFANDALGRPLSVRNGDREVAHFEYDAAGRPLGVRTPTGSAAFVYDKGRLVEVRTEESGASFRSRYHYDEGGRVSVAELPGDDRRAYAYDRTGAVAAMEVAGLGRVDVARDRSGAVARVQAPSGLSASLEYDAAGRVVAIAHGSADGAVRGKRELEYDAAGNVARLRAGESEVRYEYDAADRLVAVRRGERTLEAYEYDAGGNLVSIGGFDGGALTYDAANRLVSVGGRAWIYDARGNVVERHDMRCEYDDLNRLVGVVTRDGRRATYVYDALGRRVSKTVDGSRTHYLYDGPDLVAEADDVGNVRARYVYLPDSDAPWAMQRDGKWYFFLCDHLGTVHALADERGGIVETYAYSAYGLPLAPDRGAPTGTVGRLHPFGFAGRVFDAETGLYDFRARHYDPALGRFLQRDPAGFVASSNAYAYALGNPLNVRDSTGAVPEWMEDAEGWASAVWDKNNPITFVAGDVPEYRANLAKSRLRVLTARRTMRIQAWKAGSKEWSAAKRLNERLLVPRALTPRRGAFPGMTRWGDLNRQIRTTRVGLARSAPYLRAMKFAGFASHLTAWVRAVNAVYRLWRYGEAFDQAEVIWPIIDNWLWVLAATLLFSSGPVGIAIGFALLVFLILELAGLIKPEDWLRALLEWLGLTNADPSFVQPGAPDPPIPDRPRRFVGSAGAPAGLALHAADGRLATEPSAATFALVDGVLHDVVVDVDPPEVSLSIAPDGPRFRVDLRAQDPNLDEVSIRATGPTGSFELLRLPAPLPDVPPLLHAHDFPGGGEFRVEAVARDLAGNERAAATTVALPRERPLAVYDVSTSATAEVLEPEPPDPDADGAPAPPPADPSARDARPAWVDGHLPEGADARGDWVWSADVPYGGAPSHATAAADGPSLHYFVRAKQTWTLAAQENLVQYVFLDPAHPPKQVLLQLYGEGEQGEHRVYWGENLVDLGGVPGSSSLFHAGALPEAGRWVRLVVPADRLALGDAPVTGMLFGAYDGRVHFGPTTRSAAPEDRAALAAPVADPRTRAASLPYEVDASARFRLSREARARAWVEDAGGTKVLDLLDDVLDAGPHELHWDGRDANGALVPDGTYAFVVEAAGEGGEDPARATAPWKVSTLVARIMLPSEHALVQATVPIFGDAAGRGFHHYELDYATADRPEEWRSLGVGNTPQAIDEAYVSPTSRATVYGNLGTFNVPGADGYGFDWSRAESAAHHTLRLRVWSDRGEVAEDRVRVRVAHVVSNAGPITVTSPDGRASVTVPGFALRRPFHMFHLCAADPALAPGLAGAAARIGATIAGDAYELRPAGFRFDRPARVALPAAPGAALHVYDFAGGSWRRLAEGAEAEVDALPEGRCLFAMLADTGTAPPVPLEPPALARRLALDVAAEPHAAVALEGADGVRRARADAHGLARFEDVYLRDGANRFVATARDDAGHEAAAARPLELTFSPADAPAPAQVVVAQEGEGFRVEAPGETAVEARIASDADPEGFLVTLAPVAPGRLAARVGAAAASDPGRARLAVRHKSRVTVAGSAAEYRDLRPPRPPEIASATHPATALRLPIDLRAFPLLSLRYRVEPGATLHLIVKANRRWHGVRLAGRNFHGWSEAGGERVAQSAEFALADDGAWHDAHLDLYGALRAADPRAERLVAEAARFGAWEHTGYKEVAAVDPEENGAWEVADVRLRRAGGGGSLQLSWSDPDDPSGIADYSWVLDGEPTTVPPETGGGKRNEATIDLPAESNILYFHLRARDGAGNWGETAHFPVTADRAGPVASDPQPAPGEEAWQFNVRLRLVDAGSGVDPDSVRLTIDGATYGLRDPALSYDAANGVLAFTPWLAEPPLPAWPDGKRVDVALTEAADYAGNALAAPLAWSFVARRAGSAVAEARALTTEGGIEPAWSPDGASIAYVVEAPRRALRVISVEGGGGRTLETGLEGVATPSWSPDGASIVVAATDAAGRSDLHRVEVASGAATRLTRDGHNADPAWLPDGRIVFARDGALCAMQADGSGVVALHDDAEGARALRPQPSRDGRSVLFWRSLYDEQVWVWEEGSGARALVATPDAVDPAWGADGELIFAARGDACRLQRASAAGQLLGPLLRNDGWWDRYARVSPDGRRMVFQSTRNGFWNLWLVERRAIEELRVEPSGARAFRIAYAAPGFERLELVVLDAAGERVASVPVEEARGAVAWDAAALGDGTFLVELIAHPGGGGEAVRRGVTVSVGAAHERAPAAEPREARWPWTILAGAAAALALAFALAILLRRRRRQ